MRPAISSRVNNWVPPAKQSMMTVNRSSIDVGAGSLSAAVIHHLIATNEN